MMKDEKKILFLDRDGIFTHLIYDVKLNIHRAPRTKDELRWYDITRELMVLKEYFILVLVTNQPDYERGCISQHFMDEIHRDMAKKYFFSHMMVSHWSGKHHPWKKPNPGMVLSSILHLKKPIASCMMVGDMLTDYQLAESIGMNFLLWKRDYNTDAQKKIPPSCHIASNEQFKDLALKFAAGGT